MQQTKIKELEGKLARYQAKLAEMAKQSPDSGGRYGDEYLIEQIQVYQRMVADLKKEILDLKRPACRQAGKPKREIARMES